MFTLLISIIVVLAVLLILVILSQDSKGGVGAAFGGGASQLMGVTKTGNILEKSTWILALAILILSLSSAAFHATSGDEGIVSPNIESAKKQIISPSFEENQNLLPATTEQAAEDTTEKSSENE